MFFSLACLFWFFPSIAILKYLKINFPSLIASQNSVHFLQTLFLSGNCQFRVHHRIYNVRIIYFYLTLMSSEFHDQVTQFPVTPVQIFTGRLCSC